MGSEMKPGDIGILQHLMAHSVLNGTTAEIIYSRPFPPNIITEDPNDYYVVKCCFDPGFEHRESRENLYFGICKHNIRPITDPDQEQEKTTEKEKPVEV